MLWVKRDLATLTADDCRALLEVLKGADTHMMFVSLDGSEGRPQRRYRTPGLRFVKNGEFYAVQQKHIPELKAACEQALRGDSYFQVGPRSVVVNTVEGGLAVAFVEVDPSP